MDNMYDAATYGERVAGVYDEWYDSVEETAITTLVNLARNGRVLELGIGTGRFALPLKEKGIDIHGIDASESMVSRLRAKSGGGSIPVTIGNFADVEIEGKFSLIFVVFNTFFGLLSQEEQVRCFQNVSKHLDTKGVFLIEAFIPDLTRFNKGQCVRATTVSTDQVKLEISCHDIAQQQVTSQHVVMTEHGTQLFPIQIRYAWPAELDLMAQLAGMRLRSRWGGWRREPFTSQSKKHISVYSS
jgi:SAM-dependent methyltransferase